LDGNARNSDPIPQQLIGEWYLKTDATILAFEITSGKFYLGDDNTAYTIYVSGNTVTLVYSDPGVGISDVTVGIFDYSINNNDELTITNGIGIVEELTELSPFIVSKNKEPLDWVWEVLDDSNQTKWAAGISTLNGYEEHATKYSQSYVLNEPYDRNDKTTGWYKKETSDGVTRVVMEDTVGYDPAQLWPNNKGKGEKIKMKVPVLETVEGPNGKQVEAFHFWGTMMQKGSESLNSAAWTERTGVSNPTTSPLTPTSPATDYRRSCGWPTISLYATPPGVDEDPRQKTRYALMDGYGYTFWVKSMKNYRTYRTSVENWDYRPNEGHEPGYWYGTQPGRDATPGATGNYVPAPVGEWTKVKVIYDPYHPDYHMDVNNWIYMYNIQNNYPGDKEPTVIKDNHDKEHSIRITWSFQLQHNGGNEGTSQIEYSVSNGRHEYDVYIYGLEILEYQFE
jgi:hypothetical protein